MTTARPVFERTARAAMSKITCRSVVAGAGALAISCLSKPRIARSAPQTDMTPADNFKAEHEIGHKFHFDPADLPAPKTPPIVTDPSVIIPYSEQGLQLPPRSPASSPPHRPATATR